MAKAMAFAIAAVNVFRRFGRKQETHRVSPPARDGAL
jgi:hypothetical protein